MCGIAVIKSLQGDTVDLRDLRRMASAIQHRGPDDAGYALLDERRLALGHVRLSIIDLKSGSQPMHTGDKKVCVVFNGEIYDHGDLRRGLTSLGHRFNTLSDTEVIPHLYQQYGLDFVDHLNGEFAFLLWDSQSRRLIAVRDRMGIKPLFYHKTAQTIRFCSEAKGLLALEDVPRALSREYLTGSMFGAFPTASSTFEGIECLKPGHMLIVERDGSMKEIRYWRQKYSTDEKMTFGEAQERLKHHLQTAVKRRLVSDVPVCGYLSGGIDSSLVCSMTADLSAKIKAFTISFPHSEHDEASQAQATAAHYGMEFESLSCPMPLLAENLLGTVYHTEAALINPGAVGKYLLSRHVQTQGYKVAVTGEGGDELFAGYPYFKLEKLWRMSNGNGSSGETAALWKAFMRMETRSEGVHWNRANRWRKTEPLFGFPSFLQVRSEEYGMLIPLMFERDRLSLGPAHTPAAVYRRTYPLEWLRSLSPLNASLAMTLNQLSGYVIPVLGDRVEMAHSVEGRPPFLDRDVVEFAGTLPEKFLIDIEKLQEKHILHETFKKTLPPGVLRGHKHPYSSPDWSKLKETPVGRELFSDLLDNAAVKQAGIFRPGFVRMAKAIWRLAPASSSLHARADILIGTLLTCQMLHRLFVENRPESREDFQMVDRT